MGKREKGNPRNSAKFMILGTIANLEQMGHNPKLSFYADEKMDILKVIGVLKDVIKRWEK
jgi:ribosome-binding factor A